MAATVDRVLELDEQWRAVTTEAEQLRSEQNAASRALKGAPTPEQREQLAQLSARGRALSDQETALRAERDAALTSLPNLPSIDAPDHDTVLREVGEGKLAVRERLRKGDELQHFFETFEAMVAGLRKRQESEIARVDQILDKLGQAPLSHRGMKEFDDDGVEMLRQLRREMQDQLEA